MNITKMTIHPPREFILPLTPLPPFPLKSGVRMLQVAFFMMFTLLGLVILLNVIIALLSDSYASTKEKKDALNIREQLFLVVEWCEEKSHAEYNEVQKDLKWVHCLKPLELCDGDDDPDDETDRFVMSMANNSNPVY